MKSSKRGKKDIPDMTAEHYEEYRYSSAENTSGDNGLRLAEKVVKQIKRLDKVKQICELGCGNGWLANRLASLGYDVTGVDLSESGIHHAQKSYGHLVRFFQADIDRQIGQKLGPGAYDLVIAAEVIEHLYRPSDLLEAARSILKPGGWLLITTPYHGYFKNSAIAILDQTDKHFNPLWNGGHIKFFSTATLKKLVSQHEFSNIHFDFLGRAPWLWKSMICTAQK